MSNNEQQTQKNNFIQQAQARVDNLETNIELKTCTENCQLNNDHSSPLAKLSSSLSNIDKTLKQDYKAVAGDTTQPEDMRTLLQYDLVEEAETEFNRLLDGQIENLHAEANQRISELFTSNPKMHDADISLLGNATIVDKLLGDWYEFGKNEANSNVILHLNQRGFYADSTKVNDNLNRTHTPEPYDRLQAIETEGQMLNETKRLQGNNFRKLKPSVEKVKKIRNSQFKRR